jgi:hypothetical protein
MANKKPGKVIQMLSPENYIRTKARSLPIYECRIDSNWKEQGLANIFVTRSHTNGNVTSCLYLVDLFCLGIKNSHYLFNVSKSEYEENFKAEEDGDREPISYVMAHNIIYAALEFAEEFGFKPHKNFSSVTRFMLEEDNDDIELIDIECGKDGKPFFISGPDDDVLRINATFKQLERTAGVGNFEFLSLAADEEYDPYSDDEDDQEEDIFGELTLKEKVGKYLDLGCRMDALEGEEHLDFLRLIESIFEDIIDDELFGNAHDEFMDDLDIDLAEEEVPDEMLGIIPGSRIISNESRKLFTTIFENSKQDTVSARVLLDEFKKLMGETAASAYLELIILSDEESRKFKRKLEAYFKKFPDYPLIRIMYLNEYFLNHSSSNKFTDQNYSCQAIFNGRTTLSFIEFNQFVLFMLTILTDKGDPARLSAFLMVLEDFDIGNDEMLQILFSLSKMRVINALFTK